LSNTVSKSNWLAIRLLLDRRKETGKCFANSLLCARWRLPCCFRYRHSPDTAMAVMAIMAVMAVMVGTAAMVGTVTIMVGVDGGGAQASASTLARVTAITDTDIIPTTDITTDTDIILTVATTGTDIIRTIDITDTTTDTTGTGTIGIMGITGGTTVMVATTVMDTMAMAMGDIINERVTTGGGRPCIAARAA
jgi:hypothetical protein